MTMRAEVVTSERRLAEIAGAWNRLSQAADGGVFQSHGWITAWWQARPAGLRDRLAVGLCWAADGVLAAVMPCAIRRHRRVRVLEWAAKDCSDYCDALVDRGSAGPDEALAAAWRAIERDGGFDAVYLSHIRADAGVHGLAGIVGTGGIRLRAGRRVAQTLQVHSSGLDGPTWFKSLPKKARNNHTRGRRIVAESGALAVSVQAPGPGDTPAHLERMLALKQSWLRTTGARSAIMDADARLLRHLVAELQRQGALRIFTITCDGALVAGAMNFVMPDRMAAFFGAYDPAFERASPGTLLMVEYLMWAFGQGIPAVDFLCGQEDYKFKFANAQNALSTFVGSRTLLGRVAVAVGEHLDRRMAADATARPGQRDRGRHLALSLRRHRGRRRESMAPMADGARPSVSTGELQ